MGKRKWPKFALGCVCVCVFGVTLIGLSQKKKKKKVGGMGL
jgi:hypothetical protein